MRKLFAVLFLLANFTLLSQVKSQTNKVGFNLTISSQILKEERHIQVYLPENYHKSTEKCPVIYVLDSQKYFLNAVAYQQNLRFVNESPGFIVVGIKTQNSERSRLYNSESIKFSNYLEKELIPFIDSSYRTLRSERVFFGWQRAAAFGIEVLTTKPKLFKGYFIASPTHLNAKRISDVSRLLESKNALDNYLYFTLGDVESWSLNNTNSLASMLKEKANNKLKWKYNLFDDENHYSTTIITMNKGLKSFFYDYAPIRYYSFDKFYKDGGINGLKKLFKKRGQRYQISTSVHNDTKRYLFLLAVKENKFSAFEELTKEFPNFLTSFERETLFDRFGQFYMKHKKYNLAVAYYTKGLKKFPKSIRLKNRFIEAKKLLKK